MIKRLLALFAAFFLASGCTGFATVNPEYRLAEHRGIGLIAVAVRTNNDRCTDNESLIFHSLDDKNRHGQLLLLNLAMAKDFENPPGFFYIYPLKAGNYRFESVKAKRFGLAENLDLPFQVAEGKIIYLGEIFVDHQTCTRFTIRTSDQWQRDSKLFRERLKHHRLEEVEKQIIKPEQTNR